MKKFTLFVLAFSVLPINLFCASSEESGEESVIEYSGYSSESEREEPIPLTRQREVMRSESNNERESKMTTQFNKPPKLLTAALCLFFMYWNIQAFKWALSSSKQG